MQYAIEQYYGGYADRGDRREHGEGPVERWDDQAHDAGKLEDAQRQLDAMWERAECRNGLLGIGKLPDRAGGGMQCEEDLKNP